MPTGKINTWSVKLRDGPDGNELAGFVAMGNDVNVRVDDGSGWLLVVAQIDGEKRLGFIDGCYVLLEQEALPSIVPTAPQGGVGYDVIRAAQEGKRRGVPASVTLAQWALESDFGRLTPPGSNNPFRVKAIDGQESVQARATQNVDRMRTYALANFRKYSSLAEAIEDHTRSIAEGAEYANARLALPDPQRFVDALAEVSGKGPGYSVALRQLIRIYTLTQFD
jgi:Mannosyl-glycoprotein endo-beta-N-acetylglucosaminidase